MASKIGEYKYIEKHKIKAQGICLIYMEMIHVMLKYLEVVTNLNFIKFSTLPLEIQACIKVNYNKETEYGAYVMNIIKDFRFFLI